MAITVKAATPTLSTITETITLRKNKELTEVDITKEYLSKMPSRLQKLGGLLSPQKPAIDFITT